MHQYVPISEPDFPLRDIAVDQIIVRAHFTISMIYRFADARIGGYGSCFNHDIKSLITTIALTNFLNIGYERYLSNLKKIRHKVM